MARRRRNIIHSDESDQGDAQEDANEVLEDATVPEEARQVSLPPISPLICIGADIS